MCARQLPSHVVLNRTPHHLFLGVRGWLPSSGGQRWTVRPPVPVPEQCLRPRPPRHGQGDGQRDGLGGVWQLSLLLIVIIISTWGTYILISTYILIYLYVDFSINEPGTENRLRSQRTPTPYKIKVKKCKLIDLVIRIELTQTILMWRFSNFFRNSIFHFLMFSYLEPCFLRFAVSLLCWLQAVS